MSFVPHFDLPFRLTGGHAITVDQDTLEDVSNCVEAILRTHLRERQEIPEFGVPDLTFGLMPIKLQPLIDLIIEQEPRATVLMEQAPDQFENFVVRILTQVATKETTG